MWITCAALKENVIIGRLIPARLDLTEEGRAFLDIPEDVEEIDPISMLTGPVDEFQSEMAQGPFGVGAEDIDINMDGWWMWRRRRRSGMTRLK